MKKSIMRAVLAVALPIITAASILSSAIIAMAETVEVPDTGNQAAILGSASVELTETNAILKTRGRLSISDTDSPQRFVVQKNFAGSYGTFSINTAGAWTYVSNDALDRLNVGQSVSDSFTVASTEGATTTVQVTINGSDDKAILGSANVKLTEANEPLSAAGTLTIRDVDNPETFVAQSMVAGEHGTFSIDTAGAWTYVTEGALDWISKGNKVSDIFSVSSTDGTITTVIVTIYGSNDPAVLGDESVVLDETNEALSAGGKLSIRDVDSPETFVARRNVRGKNGTFNIDHSGVWTYVAKSAFDHLNVGLSVSDSFTVSSADGTETTVKITINGTDDAAVLSAASVSLKETDEALKTSGKISIKDVDSTQTMVAQNDVAGTSGTFSIDSNGRWSYVANSAFDELNAGQSISDSFTVASADGTTTTVQITINGTNDPAVIGATSVELTETDEPLNSTGAVSISDVDSPVTFEAWSNVSGKNGSFSIDSGGAWTYVAYSAFDYLNESKSISDHFRVSSADGTNATVKVTINGSNDAAILGTANVVLTETNAPLRTSGSLSFEDVDNPLIFTAQKNVAGSYGTFNINTAGKWSYITNDALDRLNVGLSVNDRFAVTSSDGTPTSVQITIYGSNDAAVLGTANVVLQETDAPLITGGTLSIRDVDSAATFVKQSDVVGTNGTFSIDTGGAWTYEANAAFDELNVGQSVSDSFTVTSEDGTRTSVQITIKGSNDAAVLGDANVVLTETNEVLSTAGTLSISDVDNPATFLARNNVRGVYGTFNIDTSGAWNYITSGALDRISEGQRVIDNFTVSSADGTKTTVQVTIIGTNDAAVLDSADMALTETNEVLKTTGKLSIRDVDSPERFVAQTDSRGKNGTFSIDPAGRWTYVANSAFDELNVGQSVDESFTVSSVDGTTTSVKVTINGTNDFAILGSASVILDEANEALKPTGMLSISDVDSPAAFVAQSNVAGKNGVFNIDTAGRWTYVANSAFDELNVGKSVRDSFTVASADGTITKVQIIINGTNDAAVLSSASVALEENNTPLRTSGTLSIRDVDNPATFLAHKNIIGINGTFSIDTAGRWTYVANSAFDELNVGKSISDSFTVASADGTTTSVNVTINGTNDAAVLGSASAVLAETNEVLSTAGTLSIRDVDSPATFVAQTNAKGENGNFSIDTAGRWTYVANSAFDELNVGKSISDSFTVASADGTTTSVNVTINGSNDAAILGSASVILDETNEPLKPTGRLNIRDVDSPETFVAQNNTKGKNGAFSIDPSGQWIYVANSSFDEMNVGQSISDSFQVASADGTTSSVQVTIKGTNDPAVMSAPVVTLEETNVPLKPSGKVSIQDVDSPETFVVQSNVRGKNGIFNIDTTGRWSYVANSAFDEMNVGQSISDTFNVASADGTNTTVQVVINGTNDAAVLGTAYEVLTETNIPLKTTGVLSIRDVDSPATFVAQSNIKGKNGFLSIDSSGRWTYVTDGALDWIGEGKNTSDIIVVSSADGTTTTVNVTVNGTNDAAILGSALVILDETNEPLKPIGKLSIQDVDSPETFVAQSNVKGKNGTFSIDPSGEWIYIANSTFDEMNIGQSVSDNFQVASADGTTSSVQVTIKGTNDPAIMSAPSVSLTETNDTLRYSDKLSIQDVDSPATVVARENVNGKNGTFSIDSAGAWTYVSKYAYDWLGEGQDISDNFTVFSADGTTTTVKVTINGSNDPASLIGASIVLRETNSARRAGGRLGIIDVDSPMYFVEQRNVAGENGSFNIDASGRWSYVANTAFDNLDEGQNVRDRFKVTSKDGTATTVSITIEGSEESRFDGIWIGGKIGLNRSNLGDLETSKAFAYGIEEGITWKMGILQLGAYGSMEFNGTGTGPVNYSSEIIGAGAKLGFPTGKWMPYGKLGYARTNGGDAAGYIGASHVYRSLGIEYKFTDQWSLAVDYTSSNGNTMIKNIENRLRNKSLSIGLNFYFGVPEPVPVRAPAATQSNAPAVAQPSAPETAL